MFDKLSSHSVHYKSLDCIGYPLYRVGNDGSVWSKFNVGHNPKPNRRDIAKNGAWRKLNPSVKGNGCLVVVLRNNIGKKRMFRVHRLVLMAFIGQCPANLECCHNDGDFRNNNLSNLRWDTSKSNGQDMVRHGTSRSGEKSNFAKCSNEDIVKIRLLRRKGLLLREIQEQVPLSMGMISMIINRKNWKHI
jgi:hypothetical protein